MLKKQLIHKQINVDARRAIEKKKIEIGFNSEQNNNSLFCVPPAIKI